MFRGEHLTNDGSMRLGFERYRECIVTEFIVRTGRAMPLRQLGAVLGVLYGRRVPPDDAAVLLLEYLDLLAFKRARG